MVNKTRKHAGNQERDLFLEITKKIIIEKFLKNFTNCRKKNLPGCNFYPNSFFNIFKHRNHRPSNNLENKIPSDIYSGSTYESAGLQFFTAPQKKSSEILPRISCQLVIMSVWSLVASLLLCCYREF